MLQGYLDVFVEDETGKRITTRLGPWECISCPAGVIHGYQNDSLEPVYFQVMLGRGKPEADGLRRRRALQAPRRAPEGGVTPSRFDQRSDLLVPASATRAGGCRCTQYSRLPLPPFLP